MTIAMAGASQTDYPGQASNEKRESSFKMIQLAELHGYRAHGCLEHFGLQFLNSGLHKKRVSSRVTPILCLTQGPFDPMSETHLGPLQGLRAIDKSDVTMSRVIGISNVTMS